MTIRYWPVQLAIVILSASGIIALAAAPAIKASNESEQPATQPATGPAGTVGPATKSATRPAEEPPRIQYATGRRIATLGNKAVRESSGLACSRLTSGVFWTHNDSGDRPVIYAFDLKGRDLGTFTISGAKAKDWEDIASFSDGGKSYLLLADCGDNDAKRKTCRLYIVAEPTLSLATTRPTRGTARVIQVIRYVYEDGPVDCESVAVDPATRTVYLVGKRPRRTIYKLPIPRKPTHKKLSAKLIGKLAIGWTTAMDISPDGRRAVILTYGPAVEYARRDGESWAKAFARSPKIIALPTRRQGESICYGPDGKTLYLTSEKTPTPLLEVPVKGLKPTGCFNLP